MFSFSENCNCIQSEIKVVETDFLESKLLNENVFKIEIKHYPNDEN